MAEPIILRGHALELVADLPEYDLLVTDPPYAFGGDGAEHLMSATVATVLRESALKLRKGRWAVVFSASSWRSTYYMIEAVRGVLEPVRFGTWAKPAARSKVRTPGWAWASVNIIVMRRPGKNPPGVPVESLDYIIEPPVMNGRRAELPQRVADWAVTPFCLDGGLAFDPFAGAGTLLRSAAAAGMDTLGYEIEGSDAGYVPPSRAGGSGRSGDESQALGSSTSHRPDADSSEAQVAIGQGALRAVLPGASEGKASKFIHNDDGVSSFGPGPKEPMLADDPRKAE